MLEFFEEFKQNPKFLKQKSNTPIYGQNLLNLFFSSQGNLRKEILKKSCEILEEEFLETLPKLEKSNISIRAFTNLDINIAKILIPIFNFIEKKYIESDFKQKQENFIEFDGLQTPIWAILYVLFRAGMKDFMIKIIETYNGDLKGKVKEFGAFFEKYLGLQEENRELEMSERKIAMEFIQNNNKEKIDVFQYSLYILITKYCEIKSTDLIDNIADYLWFNVKLRDFFEFIGVFIEFFIVFFY